MLTDIIANNLSILFCGINHGLKSALDEHHFSGKSNRFWKVLHLAGFTPYQIEAINDTDILRADELSKEEFELSFEIFQEKIAHYYPRYIAFLGKPAYAVFSGKKI